MNKSDITTKTLEVIVQPNAKTNAIVSNINDVLKVKIKAPAIEGKANVELIKFLAKTWGIRKSQIEIIKGFHSRDKVIRITK